MTTTQTAATIHVRWDTADPCNEGWYALVLDADGDQLAQSTDHDFPVDLDRCVGGDFEAWEALSIAFPAAAISMPNWDETSNATW